MLLLIDNYDSFTYNLYQALAGLSIEVQVVRHDAITLAEIEALAPQYIVISPGPGTPDTAGISLEVIRYFAGKIPLLGVCLGHQAIAQVFGARVVRAETVMHGKTSQIYHRHEGLFENMPNPFTATRYHSLLVDKHSLPDSLHITAWTQDEQGNPRDIMGFMHKEWPVFGVQFHPESILTEQGITLLRHFVENNV